MRLYPDSFRKLYISEPNRKISVPNATRRKDIWPRGSISPAQKKLRVVIKLCALIPVVLNVCVTLENKSPNTLILIAMEMAYGVISTAREADRSSISGVFQGDVLFRDLLDWRIVWLHPMNANVDPDDAKPSRKIDAAPNPMECSAIDSTFETSYHLISASNFSKGTSSRNFKIESFCQMF
jgi:hypothetical protein